MVTELAKGKSTTVTWKKLECYRVRAAIRLLDAEGKIIGEIALNLDDDKIPPAVASALEEIQGAKE